MSNMKSLWQTDLKLPEFPRLNKDINVDVLVIGGGFAGIMTAYYLKKKGIDCVLLEKGRICCGTTANTTAKITFQHGFIYSRILKSYGKEYAEMYYKANSEAAGELISLCKKADCSLEIKDNFVYSFNRNKIIEELKALEKIGVPAKYKDILPLPVTASGAIGFENQGQFNPLQLAEYLVKDLKIYENTWVREMKGTTAVTDFGKVRAKKVVVATHFPFINKHGSYFIKLYQHRSYIIALKNAEKLGEMYVDNGKSGFSLSSFGDFFLLGGGGHRTGKQGGSFNELRAFKEEHFKDAKEVLSWAAQDTISLDGIPYIGNYSKNTPDLYVITGFNKWGMTSSVAGADIISSMIAGGNSDFAPVFSPSRSILKPQIIVNGFETTKNLLTPKTRRCPHLGCALKYNKAEHSFDCACHGSRFSESGELLDGPANGNLKMN